jgi:sphingolipid delta-4 desaturase
LEAAIAQEKKIIIDVDIAARPEARTFRGMVGKFIWCFTQILFYALRPMFIHPIKVNKWQVINIFTQAIIMTVFIYFAGWTALLYLLVSDFFAEVCIRSPDIS